MILHNASAYVKMKREISSNLINLNPSVTKNGRRKRIARSLLRARYEKLFNFGRNEDGSVTLCGIGGEER